jgi:hypothetical protein
MSLTKALADAATTELFNETHRQVIEDRVSWNTRSCVGSVSEQRGQRDGFRSAGRFRRKS